MSGIELPTHIDLFWPTILAARTFVEPTPLQELTQKVLDDRDFTEEQRSALHGNGPETEIAYRCAWARTYLKGMGLLDNPLHGQWVLTDAGRTVTEQEIPGLLNQYLSQLQVAKSSAAEGNSVPSDEAASVEILDLEVDYLLPDLSWIPFYEELSTKLLGFKDSRAELIDILLKVYESAGVNLPKLDSQGVPSDIDPFTVFGLFNKGISKDNRIRIIDGLREALGIEAPVPTDFDGVPVLNNLNATFYRFTGDPDRGENDLDNLWNAFETALRWADQPSSESKIDFIRSFDEVKDLKGNRWKTTMGLYWVRPTAFLNLDGRNRWFIGEEADFSPSLSQQVRDLKTLPDGATYLELGERVREELSTDRFPYKDFPHLSHAAWAVSEAVNQEKHAEEEKPSHNALADSDVQVTKQWLYSPSPEILQWEELRKRGQIALGWGAIGDLSDYASKEEIEDAMKKALDPSKSYKNAAHAAWQFAREMKPGDVIFTRTRAGELIGRGVVRGDYRFEPEANEGAASTRDVEWTHVGSWQDSEQPPTQTLTDITPRTEYLTALERLFAASDGADVTDTQVAYPTYTETDYLRDVYMNKEDFDTLEYLVRTKKNVILEGAPGVGKTFLAMRLAFALMGVKDVSRVMMLQFHQSYAYEDFIEGYRPYAGGFELRKGPFYEFCKRAEVDSDNDYFVIIDEINRGNLSKIFGELFMLIEADKRGRPLNLLYSKDQFSIPENVHIIGMMNTADRGLAILDYALRRRFAFYTVQPAFDSDGFTEYQEGLENSQFDALVNAVKDLNVAIEEDDTLGEGFVIGHSYLCGLNQGNTDSQRLRRIVDFELVPLLKEYWFDDSDKVKEWTGKLRAVTG